jgi:NTE family protein
MACPLPSIDVLHRVHPARRPIGLVLSAGGARGFAHVGALKVLCAAGLPVDLLVGASMGSLIGAALAAGVAPEAMEQTCVQASLRHLLLRPRLHGPSLLDTAALEALLVRLVGDRRFEDLERPFAVTVVNLRTLEQEVVRSGPVVDAVMASIAIPLVFPPRRLGNDYYLDGGLLDPLPTSVARQLGARTIVALDADMRGYHPLRDTPLGPAVCWLLRGVPQPPERPPSRRWVLRCLAEILQRARRGPPDADAVIQPRFGRMSANDFHRSRAAIRLGELAARAALPHLAALLAAPPADQAPPGAPAPLTLPT